MPGKKQNQNKTQKLSKLLEQLEAMMPFYMQMKNSKHSHILDQKKSVTSIAAIERAASCKEVLCPYIIAQVLETL